MKINPMKNTQFNSFAMMKMLRLIALVVACSCSSVQAVPPSIAFGVWDRTSTFDPKDYPFLKGLALWIRPWILRIKGTSSFIFP
jgi:hypothetical protein